MLPSSGAPVADRGDRFSADPDFRRRVTGLLAPGTTVIVTADSLRSGASPVALTESEAPR